MGKKKRTLLRAAKQTLAIRPQQQREDKRKNMVFQKKNNLW